MRTFRAVRPMQKRGSETALPSTRGASSAPVSHVTGPVAPARGWRGAGAGRMANVDTGAVYLGTTTQMAGLFPFIQAAGLPSTGVPIGRDLLTAELVCLDPPGWVGKLTSNPGVWVQASPGVGKALDVETPIATPYGWALMGELEVGDHVFDELGRPTPIVATSQVMTGRPCFEVVLSDGSAIVADESHLWVTHTAARSAVFTRTGQVTTPADLGWDAPPVPITTARIRATLTRGGEPTHAIASAAPLQLPEADVPIDPRVFGSWLAAPDDRTGGDKPISDVYLWASETQRRALLDGLLESGRTPCPEGRSRFVTHDGRLAAGVLHLALSLEHSATIAESPPQGGLPGRVWIVEIGPPRARQIVDVRPVTSRPVRCIQVANASGLFLAGRTFVVTHNSAIAKRLMTGLCALGYLALNPGDPKGEYSPVVRGLGGQVVRIGRGLDRINPLDAGPLGRELPRLSSERREQLTIEVAARRSELLVALLATPHGLDRRPNARERFALEQAVKLLTTAHAGGDDPLIPDVVRVLRDPPSEFLVALKADTESAAWQITSDVTFALENLCSGPLGGLFDGPTTTALDLSSPAMSVDLSALLSTGDHVVAAGMLATWAYTYGALDAAAALGISHRPMVIPLDEMWRALRAGTGMVDSFDSLTRLNRAKGAVTLMITHSLRDLEALPTEADRAKAAGLMERCDTMILGASSPKELHAVAERKPLTSEEIRLVSSWATPVGTAVDGLDQPHPGRGKVLIKIGHRIGVPTQLMLTPAESRLYDTDVAMRRRPGASAPVAVHT